MVQAFSSTIRRKEMDAVLTCMVDEKIGPGELNQKLVQTVKDVVGCDGAAAFRNAGIALSYALRALNLEKGSSVMISALADGWQYAAVESCGYKPLVLDVDENSSLVTSEIVEDGIKNGGKLLILSENFGIMPDADELKKIISLGIPIIEDISKSFGSLVRLPPSEGSSEETVLKAGSIGVFSVLGLEEFDTITGGGGAVLIAQKKHDWTVLKSFVDNALYTEILPDINSSLAWVQIKEFARNEQLRKTIFDIYAHALRSGKNTTFVRSNPDDLTVWSFPVVLSGSVKDVRQYALKKDIEIISAFEKSVIALHEEELSPSCIKARSLYLRCVLFPLYPRLGSESVSKIAKVLGTLP